MSTITDFGTVSSVQSVSLNSNNGLATYYNHYYKMQGYNSSTEQYETWISTGAPSNIVPSGATLSNIIVINDWVGQ